MRTSISGVRNLLARAFPGRSGKQCRERWHNHVDAHIKKGEWSAEVRTVDVARFTRCASINYFL